MRTSLPFALIFSLVLSWSPTNAQDATSEGSHISAPFLCSARRSTASRLGRSRPPRTSAPKMPTMVRFAAWW